MKNKKSKKILLNIFATIQILSLMLGSVSPAAAVWTSLRDEDDGDMPSGVKDESEYDVVASYKKSDQTPKVSIIFSPSSPKPGEKVTATAVAQPFANEEKDLYYTWFLKREGCGVSGSGKNKFAVNSQSFDPDDSYPSYSTILEEDSEAAACDADKDGMVTVNDWKVEAARIAVQGTFKPDLGGRYSTMDEFYSEDTDGDGYQTWQGGADAERMPNHCYGYDATSGIMFEFLDKYLNGTPMCPNPDGSNDKIPAVCGLTVSAGLATDSEDPCVCSTDVDGDTYLDVPTCYNCVDGYINSTRVNNSDLWPDPSTRVEAPDTFWPVPETSSPDGIVQWWECEIDKNYCDPNGATYDDDGNVVGTVHMDCAKNSTYETCQKLSDAVPYCGEILTGEKEGRYAALCGTDANGDGMDDNAEDVSPGMALCPTNGTYQIGDSPFGMSQGDFSDTITSGLTYQDDEYVFGRVGKYSPMDELPACNCYKTGTMEDPAREEGVPYTGSDEEPLCEDRSPEIGDLLCGSLTLSSEAEDDVSDEEEEQFHVFPYRLSSSSDGVATKNYYDHTRDYDSDSDEKYTYIKGSNTGDDSFGLVDERYWGTDPRNASTAQNGKSDEANLAGAGATTFTWTYEEGDEVGVAVEGTSNIGTKFPDSSRMIMWAFSKGEESVTDGSEAACQPRYSGIYEYEDFTDMQRVGFGLLPNVLEMPTGFLDFDFCIEKSTVPLVFSGSESGAQPESMEVELSATPSKPLNDETGEGKGDVVEVQSVVTGASGTENELSYYWSIKGAAPGIDAEGLSVEPSQAEWDDEDSVICDKNSSSCFFRDGTGGKLLLDGTGISEIEFKLDIVPDDALYEQVFNDNGDGYFKIGLEVRESDDSSDPPNSRYGYGEMVIKASTSGNRIKIFHPTISGELLSSQGSAAFCLDPDEREVCQVMKNEIIGLSVPDTTIGAGTGNVETLTEFQWYLNGRAINDCDSEMSAECQDGKSTKVTFVPALGDKGETFSVSVQAKNISGQTGDNQTGKMVELSQDFKIVDPSVKIVSADENQVWPKLLGSIADPTLEDDDAGKYTEDYSESVLETVSENNVQLALEYTPSYLGELGLDEEWQIDGALSSAPSFTAGDQGTIHNVSASSSYSQSAEMNRALNNLFGVSKSDLTAQYMSDSIQIEVNEASQAAAFKSPTRFLANLLSKVPSQVLFFIRLLLSVAMTIVLAGVIFAFFPETAYDRRRIGQ